ncbi:antibiotic resistance protein VanZ [Rhodopirellula sp. P2]|uniref:antibiotic resistance protein VanZ n=1 Tax=Rhodopirellula sp. P2 TaxID=2127060 RepID=UPI003FD3EAB7
MVHAPLFAGLTMLTMVLLQSLRPQVFGSAQWARRLVWVATALFVSGVLVEMLQGMIGRSATLQDAIANGLGILAASVWFVASGLTSSIWRRSLQLLGTIFIGLTWWGSIEIIRDCWKVESDFPRIASFETPLEITRWHFNRGRRGRTQSNVTDGEFALRWKPKDAPHPAMTLLEVASDWSEVETLELDIVLNVPASVGPPESLDPESNGLEPADTESSAPELEAPVARTWEVILKVIDEDHQDYHDDVAKHFVTLRAGEPQHVVFPRQSMIDGPQDRELDLSRIKMVSLLLYQPGPGVEVDVDHIHATLKRPAVESEP